MRLGDLIHELPLRLRDASSASIDITHVSEDSRAIRAGGLFIARPGRAADGRMFIGDAVARGAAAVLTDEAGAEGAPSSIAVLVSEQVAWHGAILAERFAGSPTSRLDVVGVTGTNGKSTIVEFVQQLLQADGRRCGLIGTVRTDAGTDSRPAHLTTPSAVDLSTLLAEMVRTGCDAAAMEVSSHALDQDRAAGVRFRAGVFSNLSGDHQDYHGSMAAYAGAKAKLFAMLPGDAAAIVNVDDPAHDVMLKDCPARVVRCRCAHPERAQAGDATVRSVGQPDLAGVDARFEGAWGTIEARVPVIGRFNLGNALLATAAAHELGASRAAIERGLGALVMPAGRLERLAGPDGLQVFVDYAHTDDALGHVLGALREVMPAGATLRVVFGCGGDRDRSKRPRMGEVAAIWASDVPGAIVVTSDNPRTEDPAAIVREVVGGVPAARRGNVCTEVDRRRAIERAISEADADDVIVIAGKGHETYQILPDERGGTRRIDFDDRAAARAALARRTPARTGAGAAARFDKSHTLEGARAR